MRSFLPAIVLLCLPLLASHAQLSPAALSSKATPGDVVLTDYLRSETATLAERCLDEINSAEDWSAKRGEYRLQLQEMLGLLPMPDRTDLKAVVTGTLESELFTVEKLHFQASPGLYCTANLYLPRGLTEPAPTVLYECGHWKLIKDGVSYGNKAMYQIDGAWYARNGYVCLVLDTVLAGEIQGIHTGTRDNGLWWWNSRGYTPAGVEAWFGIRALDYLSTRPEVDTNRFGITGHSGGGAYSWTVTALDDRIKVAAPLAGVTTLEHHILDNLMDSHCDCNFLINVHRWAFPQLAAMAAPRPLLIGGTDNDRIFPLEGTLSIHAQVRRIYQLCGATDKLGLAIAPGPHDEVPELRLAVMRWFNRHLKSVDRKTEPPILVDAERFFSPEELRVFAELPANAINADIAKSFVPLATSQPMSSDELRTALREKSFAGWPSNDTPLDPTRVWSAEHDGVRLSAWDFISQRGWPLRLYIIDDPSRLTTGSVQLSVLDDSHWANWLDSVRGAFGAQLHDELSTHPTADPDPTAFSHMKQQLADEPGALAFLAPRGVGLTAWSGDAKRQTRIRRRFMLLGQTVDGMRVWDIRRAVQTLQLIREPDRIQLKSDGAMAVNAMYATLFEPDVQELRLTSLPPSHAEQPDYLNVLKVTDLPAITNHLAASVELLID